MTGYNINQRFLDPEKVLFRAGLHKGQTMADLGAGSGYFALVGGQMIGPNGKVFVVDIQEATLAHVTADARLRMLKNIRTIRTDLDQTHSLKQIDSGICDFVVFGNLFHQVKNRKNLLVETYRILKTGGKLLIVDWNEKPSPIGPKHDERVSEQDGKKQLHESGFKFEKHIDTDSYHYGLLFTK